ncbi:polysaccharide pyruvyl transferase family protein [Methylobacterium currus]|uniref:polysaccharide pyruvyl transferase family protein n=1 Tax=Methylobacterium currus TaxID=2051553 RepID=UPI001E2DEE63|nr:polysaccharide pyruvyl transferase family protein [Methylobacterium currus]UHC16681.1 polysaccharide pyruvyl transferase family protein [Methylobacterium currus]
MDTSLSPARLRGLVRLAYYVTDVPNFGDDLNAIVWPSRLDGILDERPDEAFVGIGTIIGRPEVRANRLHVFSSGAGNDRLSNWDGCKVVYWCVRGPLTARLLGLDPDAALADGAVLAPLSPALPRERLVGDRIVIIPHWETLDYPGWDEVARLTGFDLVDPRENPVSVITRIASAKAVLTESMHGAILADIYGVPWAGFATTANILPAKWLDWALSCGRALDLMAVPPPSAAPVFDRGRPPAAFGQRFAVDLEHALAFLRARTIDQPRAPTLWQRGKSVAKKSALARAYITGSGILSMSSERTADALAQLTSRLETPTDPAVILRQQERMLERLDTFRRAVR